MPQDLITSLVHHPYEPPAGFGAVMPGVHKASTVTFPNPCRTAARTGHHLALADCLDFVFNI